MIQNCSAEASKKKTTAANHCFVRNRNSCCHQPVPPVASFAYSCAARASELYRPTREVTAQLRQHSATIATKQHRKVMATSSAGSPHRGVEKNAVPRSKRKLQKHLRSSGLAYISRTGKLIPAKRVPDELCQCPQKCDEKVSMEARERLFNHFYGLGDADQQNAFLRDHMDIKARTNIPDLPPLTSTVGTGTGRSPRRITCKYLVPLLNSTETADVCQKAFVSAFVITTKRVRLQREKLISSMGLNSYSSHARSMKNINNNHIQTSFTEEATSHSSIDDEDKKMAEKEEKKLLKTYTRITKIKKKLVDDPLVPFGLVMPDSVTITPVMTADHDRAIAIVNNFFSNQLWKPEYLKTYS